MKRLFMLRHDKGGAIIKDGSGQPLYFNDKMLAKKARGNYGDTAVVTFGPDHKRYKGAK